MVALAYSWSAWAALRNEFPTRTKMRSPLTAGNGDSLGDLFAVGVNQNGQVAVLDTDHDTSTRKNHPSTVPSAILSIRPPVSMVLSTPNLPLGSCQIEKVPIEKVASRTLGYA
jgi:hypothetical protein